MPRLYEILQHLDYSKNKKRNWLVLSIIMCAPPMQPKKIMNDINLFHNLPSYQTNDYQIGPGDCLVNPFVFHAKCVCGSRLFPDRGNL